MFFVKCDQMRLNIIHEKAVNRFFLLNDPRTDCERAAMFLSAEATHLTAPVVLVTL